MTLRKFVPAALRGLALAAALGASTGALAQTTLRIGLAEDPDVLDPTMARTYVGRIVFASICDKLFDIDEKLNIIPQLALSHQTSADGKTVTISALADGSYDFKLSAPDEAVLCTISGVEVKGGKVEFTPEEGKACK